MEKTDKDCGLCGRRISIVKGPNGNPIPLELCEHAYAIAPDAETKAGRHVQATKRDGVYVNHHLTCSGIHGKGLVGRRCKHTDGRAGVVSGIVQTVVVGWDDGDATAYADVVIRTAAKSRPIQIEEDR